MEGPENPPYRPHFSTPRLAEQRSPPASSNLMIGDGNERKIYETFSRRKISYSDKKRRAVVVGLLLSLAISLSFFWVHLDLRRQVLTTINSPFWSWNSGHLSPSTDSPKGSATSLSTTTEIPSHDNTISDDNKTNPFKWSSIPPNRILTWHPCYSQSTLTLSCARLDIPMDWPTPSSNDASPRVVLAIIRLHANPHSKLGPYLGPVFFNPGGPGGSGIFSLRDHGEQLQTIVGDNHDLVSWDPRGVGASTPRIDCWGGSPVLRKIWELGDVGVVDAHPGTLNVVYVRAGAVSKVCEAGSGDILRYSSTPYHARDLLEILMQMGEERLRYWGFSYGTVLGGTFAALWPGRVERMVSDGNVDYKEWYRGSHTNFLRDTEKVMDAFYEFCHLAGPSRCAFYESTPVAIKQRLDYLISQIRISPVLIPSTPSLSNSSRTGPEIPELVTYSKIKRMLSTALYQPILRFKRVAQVLAALEAGNGLPYYEYTTLNQLTDSPSNDDNEPPFPTTPLCPIPNDDDISAPDPSSEDTPDASPAIMCSDALSTLPPNTTEDDPLTLPSMKSYLSLLESISPSMASVQISFKLSCVGRVIAPKWRPFLPTDPFLANSPPSNKIKTRFPILFIANKADNITPLISARNNSEIFDRSVVLVQDSYGHTSLAAGSGCTAGWIRGYFQRGEMPEDRMVCPGDGRPFFEEESQGHGRDGLGVEGGVDGAELIGAMRKLSREWRRGGKFI